MYNRIYEGGLKIVHSLNKKELYHSNKTWHALNSTFLDTNCIVFFQISSHWISNSRLWKVVLETYHEWPGKLMKGVLFYQDNDFFSCWGTENSQMVPNQDNMEGDQPVQSQQSCTVATATTDLCAGALSWWNRTPFVSFPGRSQNVAIVILFKVVNYLSSVVYLKGNNAVSIRKGWI